MTAARGAIAQAVIVLVALVAVLAAAFLVDMLFGRLLLVLPVVVAGVAGLAPAWAQAYDPRVAGSAPPLLQAELHAAAGAAGVWAVPGSLWALGVMQPPGQPEPWWPAFVLGPFCVAASALPHTVLTVRHAVRAGIRPPARPLLRAARIGAALTGLAGVLTSL